jgi:hypothetical protein
MKIMKIIYIAALLVICSSVSMAQGIKLQVSPNVKLPNGFSATDKKTMETKLDSMLNLYVKLGSLMDVKKKKITDASSSDFYKLFSNDARLTKDYEEFIPVDVTDPRGYANAVFLYLTNDGIQFKIEKAELQEIIDDRDFYIVTVVIDKIMYTSLNGRRELKLSSGRFMEQTMKFDVSKRDIGRMKITEISRKCKGKECLASDSYVRILNITPSYGISLGNAALSDYWNQTHSESTLNIRSSNISLGVDFLTNGFNPAASKNKALFGLFGLRYNSQTLASGMANYIIDGKDKLILTAGTIPDTTNFHRLVNITKFEETTKLQSVSLPIGVAYRLKKGRQTALKINFTVNPGFVFGSSTNIKAQQKGDFDGIVDTWRILRTNASDLSKITNTDAFGPFDAGKDLDITTGAKGDIALKTNAKFSGLTLGAMVSPTFYYDFSDNDATWGIMAGIDVSYQFLSPINSSKNVAKISDEPFKYNYGYSGSLVQHFATSMPALNVAFRIGIYQKLTKQP